MSVEQQVDRVVAGAKNTLKLLIQKLGGTVPDGTSIDGYADIVSGMTLDKMTPKAHKDTHKTGGSDALAPADIGAAAAGHTHTKANITDFPSSMTPSAHKNTHKTGGSDALAPSDIGAAAARHTHTTAQVEGLSDALTEVEPFIVEMTLSGPTTASANKTFSEIEAAFDAGRLCYIQATNNKTVAPLIGFEGAEGHKVAIFSTTVSISEHLMTSTVTIAEDNTVTIENFSSQLEITATGLLKGDGQGDITAAVAGTDYAAASHTHAASDITSGTLPVERGGTGAATASEALTNLGAQTKVKTLILSLTAAGWSAASKTQTLSVTGVTASNVVIVSPTSESQDAYSAAGVKCTAQGANSLTFSYQSIPTETLSVNIVIL